MTSEFDPTDCDVAVAEEDTGEDSELMLPWSSATLQGRCNPFHSHEADDKLDSDEIETIRASVHPETSPSVLSQTNDLDFKQALTLPVVKREVVMAAAVPEKRPESEPEQKPKKREVTPLPLPAPYQNKISEELRRYFDSLRGFEPIPLEYLERFNVKITPLRPPRKTLILDLDGTLICPTRGIALSDSSPEVGRVRLPHQGKEREDSVVEFLVRPFTYRLLKIMHIFYEIVVFSASRTAYANAIVQYLDPKRRYIDYVLHRSNCIMTREHVIKDLRILQNRKMEDMVILDNSVISFASQLENGVYVPTYKGSADDKELLTITDFLKDIAEVKDVRPYVTQFAGIKRLMDEYNTAKTIVS